MKLSINEWSVFGVGVWFGFALIVLIWTVIKGTK